MQARGLPGIADSFSLNIGSNSWIAQDGRAAFLLPLIGMDERKALSAIPLLRRELPALSGEQKALVDEFTGADYGPLETRHHGGDRPPADGNRGPLPSLGSSSTPKAAPSCAIRFSRLQRRGLDEVSIGLMQVRRRHRHRRSPSSFWPRLCRTMFACSRAQELIGQERTFFVSTKPIGILLQVNMLIAFAVGAALLWQVLSTEIATRMHEFAVLKAMGFDRVFVFGIGVAESILMALIAASCRPLLAGAVILLAVRFATHYPHGPEHWR